MIYDRPLVASVLGHAVNLEFFSVQLDVETREGESTEENLVRAEENLRVRGAHRASE